MVSVCCTAAMVLFTLAISSLVSSQITDHFASMPHDAILRDPADLRSSPAQVSSVAKACCIRQTARSMKVRLSEV